MIGLEIEDEIDTLRGRHFGIDASIARGDEWDDDSDLTIHSHGRATDKWFAKEHTTVVDEIARFYVIGGVHY